LGNLWEVAVEGSHRFIGCRKAKVEGQASKYIEIIYRVFRKELYSFESLYTFIKRTCTLF
jgi:hypothetical protein